MKCLECATRVEFDEFRIATFDGFICGDCKHSLTKELVSA